jgi:hypothetical protein
MRIRPASQPADSDPIWTILEPTIRAGETYTLPQDLPRKDALDYWFAAQHEVFVTEENAQIVGRLSAPIFFRPISKAAART